MSVVGFDFGSSTCYIAAPRTRGIETLDNDYSERATPCCVSFTSLRRYTGTSASNQKITNIANTVTGFKNLLGLKFSDPLAQIEMKKNPFVTYIKMNDDEIGFKVKYLNKEEIYTPIQLTAMMLNELKKNASRHLGTTSMNVIISCPVYFNSIQRRALVAASHTAELNLMGIINDSEATSISYGLYRTFNQQEELQSKIVMFLDIGYSSTQVYLCNFESGNKITIISSVGSTNFGGRDVDEKICLYFIEEFKKKYKIDTKTNLKSWLKLMTESSNLKKKVNSSSATFPINIECFMNDIDVTASLSRDDVDKMCINYLDNVVEKLIDEAIKYSSIPIIDFDKQITAIEIVGGSTRLTMIKNLIKKKFNRDVSTTLNCDEAVSRGCALYCAKLSPSIQIKNFDVFDFVYYDVRAQIFINDQMIDQIDLFKRGKQFPCTCLVTVLPENNFTVILQQKINENDYINVSNWFIRGVAKDNNGNAQKIKLRIRQDQNANIVVTQAQMFELVEDAVDATENIIEKQQNEETKEKKPMHKTINLVVEQINFGIFDQNNLKNYLDIENNILVQISSEIARSDSKNSYEEFIYSFRDHLDGIWNEFVDELTITNLKTKLTEEEDWLYDEGEYQKADVYVKRLENLQSYSKPIKERCINFNQVQPLFDEFSNSLLHYQKILNIYDDINDERYKHISNDKMDIVKKEYKNSLDIFTNAQTKFNKWIKSKPFPFKIQDLYNSLKNLKSTCDPIVNLPIPKVEIKESKEDVKVNEFESTNNSTNDVQISTDNDNDNEEKFKEEIPSKTQS